MLQKRMKSACLLTHHHESKRGGDTGWKYGVELAGDAQMSSIF